MKRREFVSLLGSAAAWPIGVYAEQPNRVRRVGVLVDGTGEPINSFVGELRRLGWTEGQNIRIDWRTHGGTPAYMRDAAAELLALKPDVILAKREEETKAVLDQTRTVPVVFTMAADPVAAGLVHRKAGGQRHRILHRRSWDGRKVGGVDQGNRPHHESARDYRFSNDARRDEICSNFVRSAVDLCSGEVRKDL